jgi:hypothetical protein
VPVCYDLDAQQLAGRFSTFSVMIAGTQEGSIGKRDGLGLFRRRRLSGFQPVYVFDEAGLSGGIYAAHELRIGLVLRAR